MSGRRPPGVAAAFAWSAAAVGVLALLMFLWWHVL
jgi:hypothetical protein